MIVTMHGLSTMHCNVVTEIRLANEAGFDGLELLDSKLLRYLDQGYAAEELASRFEAYGIKPVMINALKSVEAVKPETRKAVMRDAERLSAAAEAIGCPTIQLVPFCDLADRPYAEVLKLTARNVTEIADTGKAHGVQFQLEPIAWSPIHSLAQSLELIDAVSRDNVGMVIDFWHLWAGGETTPEDVSELDPSLIYGVHFCDGVRYSGEGTWGADDETTLRGYLPGEGDIPISDWVAAVKATGFDGVWSSELLSPRHWEWDLLELAKETKARMLRYAG